MATNILQRDSRWRIFYNDVSLTEFIAKLPEIKFYPEVNQNVKDAFTIIHKLLVHSYYEYLFIDVAVAKALQTFEMALKLRYKELTGETWTKKGRNLEQLIDWFRKKGYFEFDSEDFLDHVRGTRNHLSHPERHNIGGTVWFHWISTTVDLINDVYDDLSLRKQRKSLAIDIAQKLKLFLQHGAKFQYEAESLIYSHGHVQVNNLISPFQIQFSLLEVFGNTTRVKWPLIISCDIDALQLDCAKFILMDPDGNNLMLTNELKAEERKSIEEFRGQVMTDPEKLMQHNSLLFDSQNAMLEAWRKYRHMMKSKIESDINALSPE